MDRLVDAVMALNSMRFSAVDEGIEKKDAEEIVNVLVDDLLLRNIELTLGTRRIAKIWEDMLELRAKKGV